MKSRFWHYLRIPLTVCILCLIAGLYWYGAVEQLTQVNTNMDSIDQSAYMTYTRSLAESKYTYIGGRNRMPVYPFLQSLFYNPDLTDEAFFIQGKTINLVLSLGLLVGLALIFHHFLPDLHALNQLLIVAFTVFIFKAGYFQVELLFYFLNFCLFLMMWRLLKRMSWKLAVLTGIVAGLAHLTKASILPGFVIFIGMAGVKWGWGVLRNWHSSGESIIAKFRISQLLPVLLVGVLYILTVVNNINTSKRVFGHYFYNVNSTFYLWYDSWEEAKQGTRAYGDRVGWPEMPAEDIPSMSKYLHEHTFPQIIRRFVEGEQTVLDEVVHSYGYFKYILVYMCMVVIAILLLWQRARQIIMSNRILCLFLVLYFVTYLLLYFWYAPIADGNRLILAQFIPLMFTLSYGLYKLLDASRIIVKEYVVKISDLANLAIMIIVIVDIVFVLTQRVGTIFGGR